MRKVVGIDRKIKRAWMDAVLDRLAQTTDEAELRSFLDKHLKGELPGKESRAKTTGIVLRIWSGIPPERKALRERAVALLPRISGQERIWLHWGMIALAYPFFRDIAEVVGRLLALQDDFTTAQVQGRMLTTWGDRATSKEAAQKLITTLVDWEVLRSTKTKGHFLLARKMTASIPDLQLWLLEALLCSSAADEIEAQQLLRLPESFPFALSVGVADLRKHESFNIHRQGLDMDMVALRPIKVASMPKERKKRHERSSNLGQPGLFDQQAENTASENGNAASAHSKSAANPTPSSQSEQRLIEKSIKEEFLNTLSDRAQRFLQVQGSDALTCGPFAAPSVECVKQFRDGHFFGCIALTQVVIEAIVRHVWQVTLKKSTPDGSCEKYVEVLHKRKLISDKCKSQLCNVWNDHRFHFSSPVVSDQRKLEVTARSMLTALTQLQRELFGFSVRNGIPVPDHPEYWANESRISRNNPEQS